MGGCFRTPDLVIIGAGIFDMVDGRVARATGQVTTFGAFFDSVIDRYSDVALFFGLLVYYARGNHFFYLVLVAFVMVSSVMVSYTRARAESLIGSCKVGFMERPERVVLVIIGALFARWGAMAPVLWVLAVLSTITIIHRIAYTYQQTRILDAQAAEAAAQQQAMADIEGRRQQAPIGQGQRPAADSVVQLAFSNHPSQLTAKGAKCATRNLAASDFLLLLLLRPLRLMRWQTAVHFTPERLLRRAILAE